MIPLFLLFVDISLLKFGPTHCQTLVSLRFSWQLLFENSFLDQIICPFFTTIFPYALFGLSLSNRLIFHDSKTKVKVSSERSVRCYSRYKKSTVSTTSQITRDSLIAIYFGKFWRTNSHMRLELMSCGACVAKSLL